MMRARIVHVRAKLTKRNRQRATTTPRDGAPEGLGGPGAIGIAGGDLVAQDDTTACQDEAISGPGTEQPPGLAVSGEA